MGTLGRNYLRSWGGGLLKNSTNRTRKVPMGVREKRRWCEKANGKMADVRIVSG